ncbi:epoxide hydrolase [Sandaracinobacter sp. RS1-74]|uniref:epoxide hydrolase family protein n=1 Tax=Sandaracinobacteroides sayramensis TaxID=2913411 RepID=UPI001EDA77B6|nr:epoxide hydrolase family protein [Sandaracinobacteroides sayramensis]MCG2840951.1 epoxide hydrolase [Sandaracinobacteroides sayramensis]
MYPPPLDAEAGDAILPFHVDVPQPALDDLARRLAHVRWPDAGTVADWSQGVPLDRMQALVGYWRDRYDWRRCEAAINRWPGFRTRIDGLGIHFLHVRSPHAGAMPMLLTHGWPGSILEFLEAIGPLTDPQAHGGDAADAFHVVIPSLPGYGFSDKPDATGWNVERIARTWHLLMRRLGYDRYVAQGGDWGSAITRAMAVQQPPGLLGIHLNMVVCFPPPDEDYSDPQAVDARETAEAHKQWGLGYSTQQSTRPQTLGYALADSPVGQAAWIYEKFHAWTDNGGEPEEVLSRDSMLDTIMLYWLTDSAASSARLYWESFRSAFGNAPISLPVACSIFPREMRRPPRRWAERIFSDIIHWGQPARGGHFAALEQPDLFVQEVRTGLRSLR